MKYLIFQKVVVNQPHHETISFNSLEECVSWLTTQSNPIDYVVVDSEINEWFDGYTLTSPNTDYRSLFSYSLA